MKCFVCKKREQLIDGVCMECGSTGFTMNLETGEANLIMKYKVGDRVLVEAEIEACRNGNEYDIVIEGSNLAWVNDSYIYSKLDHDFKPGEIVEVRHEGETWVKREFIAMNETNKSPVVVKSFFSSNLASFRHIRKLKPDPEIIELNGKKYREVVE